MNKCVYQHIGDDGVVLCDNYSNYAHGIITFCNQKNGCVGKKPTNADRIRSMTDDELAELLTRNVGFCCPVKGADCTKEPSCTDCFLKWLKQEAES